MRDANADDDNEEGALLPRAPNPPKFDARAAQRTLFVQWALAWFDGADGKVLSALFGAFQAQFGFTPSDLGVLVLGQSLAVAVAAPIWALLADNSRQRIQLLAIGCFLWALWTALMANSSGFVTMLVLRVLTGGALGSLTPISQSIVSDIVEPTSRGRHFGYIGASTSLGNMVGGILATSVGGIMIGQMAGWRAFLIVLASCSLVLACVAPIIATDPRSVVPTATESGGRDGSDTAGPLASFRNGMHGAWCKLRHALTIPTFTLIVLQGLFGLVPWQAQSFSTLWLQLIGLSDSAAGIVTGVATLGVCLGNILGGVLGDLAAVRQPDTGRVRVAQLSVILGVIFQPLILYAVPWNAEHALTFAFLFFLQGLTCSWVLASTNRPIFSELVPSGERASLLAWCLAFEGVFAAIFGAPVVGLMAEHLFGYAPLHKGDTIRSMPAAVRMANASALAQALLWMVVVPWLVCFAVFSLVADTYPRDRERARREQMIHEK